MSPPTEFRRHAVRVGTNYAKLLSTLVLGIALVPVLLRWVGPEGFGLIALISTATGLSGLLREVIERSMIRELGSVLHTGDESRFARAYASAFVVCAAIVPFVLLVFALIYAILPLLDIPHELLGAARVMVLAEAASNAIYLAIAPASNMYIIQERFVAYNAWSFLNRLCYLAAALTAWLGFGITDTPSAVAAFGILTAVAMSAVNLAFVIALVARDRRFLPRLSRCSRAECREILSVGGWNAGMTIAVAILHERMPQFFLNVAFGLGANAAFGIAQRLSSYVRMVALGVTSGLDAVTTRASAASKDLRRLAADMTRLNALATLPALAVVAAFTGPLIDLWIGRSVQDDPSIIPDAVMLSVLMLIPVITRAFSDVWTGILYGAGYLKAYAPLVVYTSLLTPALAALGLWALPHGSPIRFASPVLAYVTAYTAVHAIGIPRIAADRLGLRVSDLLDPIVRPLLACLLACPALILPRLLISEWTLPRLGLVTIGFGALYTPLAWFIAMKSGERARIGSLIGRASRRAA